MKEMNIPLGPRKKILGFIKEEKAKEEKQATGATPSVVSQPTTGSTQPTETYDSPRCVHCTGIRE